MTIKPWPYPADVTTAARARRIANNVLVLLAAADPDAAGQLVTEVQRYGETWFGTALITHADTDAITTAEAATLLGVAETTIRKWASTPHPNPRRARQGQMLLSRFGWRGRSRTYLVRNLRAAHREHQLMKAARKMERRHARGTRR